MSNIECLADKMRDNFRNHGICDCCKYGLDCNREVRDYGYGVHFPPCSDLKLDEYFCTDTAISILNEL